MDIQSKCRANRYGPEELLDLYLSSIDGGLLDLDENESLIKSSEFFLEVRKPPLSLNPMSDEEQATMISFIQHQANCDTTRNVYRPPINAANAVRPPRNEPKPPIEGTSPGRTFFASNRNSSYPSSITAAAASSSLPPRRWKRSEDLSSGPPIVDAPVHREISRSIMSKPSMGARSQHYHHHHQQQQIQQQQHNAQEDDMSIADILYGGSSEINMTGAEGLPEWLNEDPIGFDVNKMTFDQNGVYMSKEEVTTAAVGTSNKVKDSNKEIDNLVSRMQQHAISNERRLPPTQEATHQHHQWFYIDPQGKIRGPFSSDQMNQWYIAGYFSPSILIKRHADEQFHKLGEYASWLGADFFYSPRSEPVEASWAPNRAPPLLTEDISHHLGFHDPSIMAASRPTLEDEWATGASRRRTGPNTNFAQRTQTRSFRQTLHSYDSSDFPNGVTFTRSSWKEPSAFKQGNTTTATDLLSHAERLWLRDELVSMYGLNINPDGLVHILQQFNNHSDIEAFLVQMHGPHPKLDSFISQLISKMNFHRSDYNRNRRRMEHLPFH